jgi:hypothetical protein
MQAAARADPGVRQNNGMIETGAFTYVGAGTENGPKDDDGVDNAAF